MTARDGEEVAVGQRRLGAQVHLGGIEEVRARERACREDEVIVLSQRVGFGRDQVVKKIGTQSSSADIVV